MKDRAIRPTPPGLDENHREVAAAEAGTAQKTASFAPREASVKAARASILETICEERTAGGQGLREVPPGVIGQRTVSRGVVSAIPSIVSSDQCLSM